MAEDAPSSLDPVRFPPLPLVSGTGVEGRDGSLERVTGVAVVITTADGTQHVVDLESRYGGWWPPPDD